MRMAILRRGMASVVTEFHRFAFGNSLLQTPDRSAAKDTAELLSGRSAVHPGNICSRGAQEFAYSRGQIPPGARKIKVLLLSLSTYSTMAGLAAAWHLRGVRTRICLMYTDSNVN